jgi:hypothetical protein
MSVCCSLKLGEISDVLESDHSQQCLVQSSSLVVVFWPPTSQCSEGGCLEVEESPGLTKPVITGFPI